jgi:hypothetical protein
MTSTRKRGARAPLADIPATYLLRDIDPALWREVKARAAIDHLPLRSVLLHLAEAYAKGTASVIDVQTGRRAVRGRR